TGGNDLITALATGENIDEVVASIASESTGGASGEESSLSPEEAAQAIAETFQETLSAAIESGADIESAVSQATEATAAVMESQAAVTAGESSPESALLSALSSGDNVTEAVDTAMDALVESGAVESGAISTETFQEALAESLVAEGEAAFSPGESENPSGETSVSSIQDALAQAVETTTGIAQTSSSIQSGESGTNGELLAALSSGENIEETIDAVSKGITDSSSDLQSSASIVNDSMDIQESIADAISSGETLSDAIASAAETAEITAAGIQSVQGDPGTAAELLVASLSQPSENLSEPSESISGLSESSSEPLTSMSESSDNPTEISSDFAPPQELYNDILTELTNAASDPSTIADGSLLETVKDLAEEYIESQGGNTEETALSIDNFVDQLTETLDKGVDPEVALEQAMSRLDLSATREQIESESQQSDLANALASGENIEEVIADTLPEGVDPEGSAADAMFNDLQESMAEGTFPDEALKGAEETLDQTIAVQGTVQNELSTGDQILKALSDGEDVAQILGDHLGDLSPDALQQAIEAFTASIESGGSPDAALQSAETTVGAVASASESVQGEMTPEASLMASLASGENVEE
ncbi:hypothetical protein, partial [Desulfamplus magnetovallimortis]|uniref:hypothetical protein n=1 Tax=Desulfamplus magnetovallimortis TaxID=1246637 RepID=UPI001648C855